MKKTAVIGDPVNHSLSPLIFRILAEKAGLTELDYQAVRVPAEQLSFFMSTRANEYLGMNVTLPHKKNILPFLDAVAPEARLAGAVNCVTFQSGKSAGSNTDITGILKTLDHNHVSYHHQDVLVLGAGGAAYAVCAALLLPIQPPAQQPRAITIWNRSLKHAQNLVDAFQTHYKNLGLTLSTQLIATDTRLDDVDPYALVINTTPLGMSGYRADEGSLFIFEQLFKRAHKKKDNSKTAVAFDLIYTPEETPFLKAARKAGLKTVGGLEMLVYQALASWAHWFPHLPWNEAIALEEILPVLRHELAVRTRRARILLCGFMGSGKSKVGGALAAQLKWDFIDTDRQIEEKSGQMVADIFSAQGEPHFRRLEVQAIAEACRSTHVVIALGGGALNSEAFRNQLNQVGLCVYLETSPQVLSERLMFESQTRPLLANVTPIELRDKIKKLMAVREPHYQMAAYKIKTDDTSPEHLATQIKTLLETERA